MVCFGLFVHFLFEWIVSLLILGGLMVIVFFFFLPFLTLHVSTEPWKCNLYRMVKKSLIITIKNLYYIIGRKNEGISQNTLLSF